jgi:hypothetical protein
MEIHLHNPWLTYGMGLHRLREAGLLHDIFDSLDERPFTLDQLHEFCNALFIGDKSGIKLPHPRESLISFFQTLKMLVDKEEMQWNPVRKKMMPWIEMTRLEAIHCRRSRDNHRSKSLHDPPGEYKQQAMPKKYERSSSEPPNVSTYVHMQTRPPCNPLQHFLLTVPQRFPPINTTVEMHEYFSKWKTFDNAAFDGFSGDELVELLAKGEFVPYHFCIFVGVCTFSFCTHLSCFVCYIIDMLTFVIHLIQLQRSPSSFSIQTNCQKI